MDKKPRRVRKGPRGLYYTYGKLDEYAYNNLCAPFHELLWRNVKSLVEDLEEVRDYLWAGIQALIWLFLLPVAPFIRVLVSKKYAREMYPNIKLEEFSKDYCEVLSWDEEEEDDND